MKNQIKNFALPIGLGLVLFIITFFASSYTGCTKEKTCAAGEVLGNDNICYSCSSGSYATKSPSGNCSSPSAGGVYCCTGSGGGGGGGSTAYCNPGNTYNYSSQMCCPNNTPYYYPGTHGITGAGCYASCPYVNDCGNKFTKY